ncbi:MAG: alpha/beta fold hydrolase [Woeseiaceae bacterium]|nr:alpha/beta fold hydrolase [Woeseiaceae bacterium]
MTTLIALGLTAPAAAALELEDCRISAGPAFPGIKARCGRLERPLNPDDPDAGTIELKVAVVPALNLEPEPDPLVPLAGGPGQGAISFYSAQQHAFEHVRRNRDILLVDQRGTGASARLDCAIDEELIEGQYSLSATIEATEECLANLPHDPTWFTTSVAVRDLEAVREALAYPQLNLYGVSYGSRVAQHYARRYPDAVRSIVLDGVVPPQLALGPDIAVQAQRALDRIFDRCAEDAGCSERFPDIAATFDTLKSKLSSKPVTLRAADPLTGHYESVEFGRNELAAALRLLSYHPNTIAMIPLLVAEAEGGNYRPLVAQFRMNMSELSEAIALGMHNAVMCTEDAPFYDDELVDRDALASSYIGPVQLEALTAICSIWPTGPIDPNFKVPLDTDAPVLLLSGSADPITPPDYADMAAIGLKRAWLLTMPDQGHGQLAVGCTPRLIERFVANAGLDDVDTDCRERNFVMPFFLDFSGPAP